MPEEKIGRYIVRSEIGRGGMATVFHAYDPSFERDVAIKVLPVTFLRDPQLRTRFEREAKMIALLEHPAIVPVYDIGEHNQVPYIVMRLMGGGSMADRLKKGPFSPEETCAIIARLAPALDAAHARGIIHRDIKPANVLFDQYGNSFLSDFGIARLAQASNATTITGENILGTPAYMSPEQVQGDKAIDGRSDIYAMGVLIYQMLTGQMPYQADTPTKVMLMHILQPVPSLKDHGSGALAEYDPVISQAMAKRPEDRFANASSLAQTLEMRTQSQKGMRPYAASAPTMVAVPPPIYSANPGANQIAPSFASTGAAAPAVAVPAVQPKSNRTALFAILALVGLIVLGSALIFGGMYLYKQANSPKATLAVANTGLPTSTQVLPSNTPVVVPTTAVPIVVAPTDSPSPTEAPPTETPTVEPPTETPVPTVSYPIIGGADKIAFIKDHEVWLARLDGSELQQLTNDKAQKSYLQWTPDGQSLLFISGKCVQSIRALDGQQNVVVCFNYVDLLEAFEISRDGQQVAISIDHQLYIVPYDVAALSQVKVRSDLANLAPCKDYAPYARNFIKTAHWSRDGKTLAAVVLGVIEGGKRADIIQVLDVSQCTPNPNTLDNFPPPRFTYKAYEKNPVIQSFTWDGDYLFALTSNIRNDGFGDLYIYNMDLHKAAVEVNPIQNRCCYRDPQFSPDGTYLIFAYQDYLQGSASTTKLYYLPYGSMGTQAEYQPLPLPDISDPREKPQPVLGVPMIGQ